MMNVKDFGQQRHRQQARERRSDYGNNSNFFFKIKSRSKNLINRKSTGFHKLPFLFVYKTTDQNTCIL